MIKIRDHGAALLAEYLADNTTLRHLDLRWCVDPALSVCVCFAVITGTPSTATALAGKEPLL